MKKVKIKGKLSLDKMTIAKLNDHDVKGIAGGGIASLGRRCTDLVKCGDTGPGAVTRGIWCTARRCITSGD